MSEPRHPDNETSELLEAILAIASDLDLESVLRRIVLAACELTRARYGALGVLDGQRTGLAQFVTHGLSEAEEAAIGDRPKGLGVLGLLITEPRALRIADLGSHERSHGFPKNHPPMKSFIGVPVRVRGSVFGNLYLAEKQGAAEFTESDERVLASLAAAVGVAIENLQLHERLGELALYSDRDRIARDLHDTVIQRLFAVGLSLQGLARIVDPPSAGERLSAAVDELDLTIADIRSTIFALQVRDATGARAEVTRAVTDSREALGFLPRLTFEGPVDALSSPELGSEAAAVVREALANAARHARATRVEVVVSVGPGSGGPGSVGPGSGSPGSGGTGSGGTGELCVTVSDDGIGIRRSGSPAGQGLRNMASRAEKFGGSLDVRSEPGEGTAVIWRASLS